MELSSGKNENKSLKLLFNFVGNKNLCNKLKKASKFETERHTTVIESDIKEQYGRRSQKKKEKKMLDVEF